MTNLELLLRELISGQTGRVSAVGTIDRPGRPAEMFAVDPDRFFLAASVAKLSIASYVIQEVTSPASDPRWEDILTLREHHVRGGTGVLRHFPIGSSMTLRQAFTLMLAESDNTATNVVLGHIGSQTDINNWLHASSGRIQTGLTTRPDSLFESSEMRALDALELLERLEFSHEAMDALSRNHFYGGLRLHLEQQSPWRRRRYKLVALGAKACVKYRLDGWPKERLLRFACSRPASSRVVNKEGLLQIGNDCFRHDVGVIALDRDIKIRLAIFTMNAPADMIGDLTKAITNYAKSRTRKQ